jgi:hypothetical protein
MLTIIVPDTTVKVVMTSDEIREFAKSADFVAPVAAEAPAD